MEINRQETTQKRVSLPAFTMTDVVTLTALIGVIILLIMSKDVPEYLLVIVSIGIGVKVEPTSSKVVKQ